MPLAAHAHWVITSTVVIRYQCLWFHCIMQTLYGFQTVDDAMVLFYPELNQTLPERSYADECSLFTPDHPEGISWTKWMYLYLAISLAGL